MCVFKGKRYSAPRPRLSCWTLAIFWVQTNIRQNLKCRIHCLLPEMGRSRCPWAVTEPVSPSHRMLLGLVQYLRCSRFLYSIIHYSRESAKHPLSILWRNQIIASGHTQLTPFFYTAYGLEVTFTFLSGWGKMIQKKLLFCDKLNWYTVHIFTSKVEHSYMNTATPFVMYCLWLFQNWCNGAGMITRWSFIEQLWTFLVLRCHQCSVNIS